MQPKEWLFLILAGLQTIYAIPLRNSPDQILSLGDGDHLGGKIVASLATVIAGGPPNVPPVPAK
jgi:hypothetical protein